VVKKRAWYTSIWVIILIHVLVWGIWFALPYLTQPNRNEFRNFKEMERIHQMLKRDGIERPFPVRPDEKGMLRSRVAQNILLVGLFYLNAYVLIPVLLYRKRYGQYVFSMLGLLLLFLCLSYLFDSFFIANHLRMRLPWFIIIIFFLFIAAFSSIYRIAIDHVKAERLSKEKENENLKTELSFLRSQISPHFMFNVLNNMVSLARKRSDQLEPSLIRLSGMMRYMLYETDAEKVGLKKELDYLKSYVELQQQRFADSLQVAFNVQADNLEHEIEPMLLIPFIENAFKHGTGLIEQPQITISITVKEGSLLMEVRNRINNNTTEIKDKTAGIGLNNVKRRLSLLYGSNHHLLLMNEDNWYTVLLQLKLM
jgi:two-component system LytT family sensor kinase